MIAFSDRLEVGRWSEGRPVYKKVGEPTRFLLVKEGKTEWYVSGSIAGSDNYLVSGRATNSPGSPWVGPSVRSGTASWRYYDGNNWKKVTGTTHYQDTGSIQKRYFDNKTSPQTKRHKPSLFLTSLTTLTLTTLFTR